MHIIISFHKQDNCLLECKMKKVSAACGCTPWYIRQKGESIFATISGKKSFFVDL